jgi:hypothetical protein
MNLASYVLDPIEVTLPKTKAVLRALLHTILFLRMPGPVRPQEVVPSELDTIEYVMNPLYSLEEDLEKFRGLLRKKKFIQKLELLIPMRICLIW